MVGLKQTPKLSGNCACLGRGEALDPASQYRQTGWATAPIEDSKQRLWYHEGISKDLVASWAVQSILPRLLFQNFPIQKAAAVSVGITRTRIRFRIKMMHAKVSARNKSTNYSCYM